MISNRDVIARLRVAFREVEAIDDLYKRVDVLIRIPGSGFKEKDLDELSSCLLTDDVQDVIEFFETLDARIRKSQLVIKKFKARIGLAHERANRRMWRRAVE